MAELGTAAIGAGAAFGAVAYAAATGFIARHENVHSVQVADIRLHIFDFEAAYRRGEVTEEDWGKYLVLRTEARRKELEYEEYISAYKDIPAFRFVTKWKKKRLVRQKKKELQWANRSLRLHYYESTSDASWVIAVVGLEPHWGNAHNGGVKHILSRAEYVRAAQSIRGCPASKGNLEDKTLPSTEKPIPSSRKKRAAQSIRGCPASKGNLEDKTLPSIEKPIPSSKTYVSQLRIWNGIYSHDNILKIFLRPFPYPVTWFVFFVFGMPTVVFITLAICSSTIFTVEYNFTAAQILMKVLSTKV